MRLLTLFLFLLPFSLTAQTVCTLESRERLDRVLTELSQKDFSQKSIQELTVEIGGTLYPNQPSFMSENPQFYVQLSNADFLKSIKADEAEIAKRTYHFIPKAEIESLEKNIQSGDLIAITASMRNLDIVHVGFAIEKNGRIHLMHART